MEPVFGQKAQDGAIGKLLVSFLELVEIMIASRFRNDDRLKLDRIRRAHEYARKEWNVPFPFASLDFRAFGGHLMHQFEDDQPGPGHMAFDMHGQWALPGVVQEQLDTLVFEPDDKFASRWYPYGLNAGIVIDPHLAAGRPIVEGTRVPVSAIWERFEAGESIRALCLDYGLKSSTVEEVIRLAAA
jgi:uncharacterized protein (DUF433 family)